MLAIYAVTEGLLDDVAVEDISRTEAELREFVRLRRGHVLDVIRRTGALPEGDEIADAIAAFKQTLAAGE